jgi:hypothetical protein
MADDVRKHPDSKGGRRSQAAPPAIPSMFLPQSAQEDELVGIGDAPGGDTPPVRLRAARVEGRGSRQGIIRPRRAAEGHLHASAKGGTRHA